MVTPSYNALQCPKRHTQQISEVGRFRLKLWLMETAKKGLIYLLVFSTDKRQLLGSYMSLAARREEFKGSLAGSGLLALALAFS